MEHTNNTTQNTSLTPDQIAMIRTINSLDNDTDYATMLGYTTKRAEAAVCIPAVLELVRIATLPQHDSEDQMLLENSIIDTYRGIMQDHLGYADNTSLKLLSKNQIGSIQKFYHNMLAMFNASAITLDRFKSYDNLQRQFLLNNAQKFAKELINMDQTTFDIYLNLQQLLDACSYINNSNNSAPLLYQLRIRRDMLAFCNKIGVAISNESFNFASAKNILEPIAKIFDTLLTPYGLGWACVQKHGLDKFYILAKHSPALAKLLESSKITIDAFLDINIKKICSTLKSGQWIIDCANKLNTTWDEFLSLGKDKLSHLNSDPQHINNLAVTMHNNQWSINDVLNLPPEEFFASTYPARRLDGLRF